MFISLLFLLPAFAVASVSNDVDPHAYFRTSETGNAEIGNSRVRILTEARYGGAISGLWHNGKQFINNSDHGRQIQTAWSLNGLGECFNPTEGGAASDHSKKTSSSQILSFEVGPGEIKSSSHPAYWLTQGQSSSACPKDFSSSLEQIRTDQVFKKHIQLGYQSDPELIAFDISIESPREFESIQVEALTAYLTPDFNVFEYLGENGELITQPLKINANDPTFKEFSQLSPVVISTSDQKHALGVIGGDTLYSFSTYYGFQFGPASNGTSKWSVVYRNHDVKAETLSYKVFVFVGTRESVKARMAKFSDPSVHLMNNLVKPHKSKIFEPLFYAEKYSDLKNAYGNNEELLNWHFFSFGISEGRQGSPQFSAPQYLQENPLLIHECGNRGYACAMIRYLESLSTDLLNE